MMDLVSRERFVGAMREVAASVTVVTTDGPCGRHGATVSAFSSVSADPPTVLVCLHADSRIAKAVEMLKQPETNLTEIFLACGFRNRSYFNRMFKRIKGISPVGYQKRFHSEF